MRREGAAPSTWLFMLVVAAAVSVAVLTGWMVNVVLPLMRAEFGVSAAHVGWVVTGYALAYAAGEYPTGDNDFTGTSKWVELQPETTTTATTSTRPDHPLRHDPPVTRPSRRSV
jgi:hypothetical protein